MAEQERIVPVNIYQEVKTSFLDYAMSVIVSRALPDVRDGLKPVHRRILYSMNEMGSTFDKPHRKSARIVGEVMGKYHPHGDTALYDTLTRMAQDFSSRYCLIDGHGNFGSLDGDAAAAMRYTEARLAPISSELLTDIQKNTVDFRPNFDESLQEPVVLPSRFPNLLANGSSGIAVGMATNIPPHNLGEVIDALHYLMAHPEAPVESLLQFIKGPDFPTGGIILDSRNIAEAYRTGRGIIKIRGRVYIEKKEKGRNQIIINELPYQQNKARLVEKIAELVKKKKTEGIVDLRDESDRSGVRVVIEVRRDYDPQVIINQLYQFTPLHQTFGIIMLALVNGEPKVLNLKEILEHYLEHQKEVIRRRSRYDLQRAEDRLHIVEGLKAALSRLDEVIALIRRSPDAPTARTGLMTLLKITEKQAQAILDMRLHRLTGLEISKLDAEYQELVGRIAYLKRVLAEPGLVLQIIRDELQQIKEKHGDERRTQIMGDDEELSEIDLIFEEDVVITITDRGYIKRLPLATYRSQRRGGKGVIGMQTLANDRVEQIYITSTHHRLLCFSNLGKVYMLQAHEVPESSRQSRGTPLVNLLPLDKKEFITALLPIYRFERKLSLFMVTSRGIVKKTLLKEYRNTRKNGIIALTLDEGDELIAVQLTDGHREILIGTSNGLFVRFYENEVREMGRTARGVKGITLGKGAKVVGADLIADAQEVFMVTEQGYGKRILAGEFTAQHRGGKGVIGIKISPTSGPLIGFLIPKEEQKEVILITARGQVIRHNINEVSVLGRYSRGVTLMDVEQEDRVVNFSGVE